MSTTETVGQLAIDGLEVSARNASVQGTIEVPAALFDQLRLGQHLRAVVVLRVSSKTDRHKRTDDGDDTAGRTIGLGVIETASVKRQTVDGQEVVPAAPDPKSGPEQKVDPEAQPHTAEALQQDGDAKPKRRRKPAETPEPEAAG